MLRYRNIISVFIVSFLGMCPMIGHAGDPPPSGNADAYDGMVMERWITQMNANAPFDPRNLAIFSEIKPALKVADQLPEFGKALRLALTKKWRFSTDGIQDCPSELTRYSSTYQKVGCQHASSVVINPDWYFKLTTDELAFSKPSQISALKQRQKDMVLHQLLLGINLGKGISEDSLAKAEGILTREPPATASELQDLLESSGFGVYGVGANSTCQELDLNQDLMAKVEARKASVTAVVAPLLPGKSNPKPYLKERVLENGRMHTYGCTYPESGDAMSETAKMITGIIQPRLKDVQLDPSFIRLVEYSGGDLPGAMMLQVRTTKGNLFNVWGNYTIQPVNKLDAEGNIVGCGLELHNTQEYPGFKADRLSPLTIRAVWRENTLFDLLNAKEIPLNTDRLDLKSQYPWRE